MIIQGIIFAMWCQGGSLDEVLTLNVVSFAKPLDACTEIMALLASYLVCLEGC